MLDIVLIAILLGVILAFTIGPVFFVLLETSATKGIKSALALDLGVIVADIIYIIVAFYSTNSIIEKIKDNPNLLIFGGLMLIVYGLITYIKTIKSFRAIVREHYTVDFQINYFKLFIKGFLLNFINIGVLVGWLGFIVIGNSMTTTKNEIFIFLSTILITYFVIDIIKILAAKTLKNKLTPRLIIKTKKIVAIVILGFGLLLLAQGLFPKQQEQIKEKIKHINPIKL